MRRINKEKQRENIGMLVLCMELLCVFVWFIGWINW